MADSPALVAAEVVATLPLRRFRVSLAGGAELTAVLARGVVGRARRPRAVVGARVLVERSPYDARLCRIVRALESGTGGRGYPAAPPDRAGA